MATNGSWSVVGLALLALAMPATSGCLQTSSQAGGSDDAPNAPGTAGDPVEGPLAPTTNVSRSAPGAEPVLAVGEEAMYLQGIGQRPKEEIRNRVWRSTDDGASWTELTLPERLHRYSADGFVALAPDGTVYVANAYGPDAPPGNPRVFGPNTPQIARSADQGRTWETLPMPRLPESIHRMWIQIPEDDIVHVAVASQSAPASTIVGSAPGPRALYHVVSENGGETWSNPTVIHPTASLGSTLLVAEDGSLHIALFLRDPDRWELATSKDGGQTWQQTGIARFQGAYDGVWTSLSEDDAGTLHLSWVERRQGRPVALHAFSTDGGETWSAPRPLLDTDGSQMLAWSKAAGAGVLDAVWYATDASAEPGSFDAHWRIEVARVANADTEEPHVTARRTTPWVVHQGDVCIGASCYEAGADRSLLDFVWLTHDREGDTHVAFATTQGGSQGHARPVHGVTTLG